MNRLCNLLIGTSDVPLNYTQFRRLDHMCVERLEFCSRLFGLRLSAGNLEN